MPNRFLFGNPPLIKGRVGCTERGEAPSEVIFPPSPYQGEGDKGDRVDRLFNPP